MLYSKLTAAFALFASALVSAAPLGISAGGSHHNFKRDAQDVANKINGVTNDVNVVGGAINGLATAIVDQGAQLVATGMTAEYVMDADEVNDVLLAAAPSINMVVGTVVNATGHGGNAGGDGGNSTDGGGGGGPTAPSPPQFQVLPMCTLNAGATNGTYSVAQFAKWKLQWQNGMTNLNLNTMRTTVCQATTPLSAAEVQFFEQYLTNPTIITPDEGAFTAQEEAQFQFDLPRMDQDPCQNFINKVSAQGSAAGVTQREINLIVAACSQVTPVTILPTITSVCVVVVDAHAVATCIPYTSFPAISDWTAPIPGQPTQSQAPIQASSVPQVQAQSSENDQASTGSNSGSSSSATSHSTAKSSKAVTSDDSDDSDNAPTISTDKCKTGDGSGPSITAKYNDLLDTLDDGGSLYYLQMQVDDVCSSKALTRKQVKKIKATADDATIITPKHGALLTPGEEKTLLKEFKTWKPAKQTAFVTDITNQGASAKEIAAFSAEVTPTITAGTCKDPSKTALPAAQFSSFLAILTKGGSQFYLQMLVDSFCASGALNAAQIKQVKSTVPKAKILTPPQKALLMPAEETQLLAQFKTWPSAQKAPFLASIKAQGASAAEIKAFKAEE
ncbi:hypothetical protein FRB96_000652 [Tulasnella sp. 330]|nr:hypothetical protein FRB96_000652 [Tulasnella sp. 330]KAG8881184.1 hypothetical protein FRB97_009815 [Tulasnella sp. 331]KAG8887505.1 hypothetical protein FRB98_009521 [Tulasnella sp. 332]